MSLDVDFIRSQFPAFQEPSLQGHAFFENAGGSFTCAPVIARLERYYRQRKVQPYGAFKASQEAGAEMDLARRGLADVMGVKSGEVSFGPSTTQNVYVLAQAFGEMLGEGDAIVVTNQDHEANTGAWRRLADRGIEVREWRIDPETGHLDVEALKNLLDGKVRLVCFPHCSNVVGEINDVAAIADIAHAAEAVVCVDGVSYAPHGIPNVDALGADIYLFSAYKTYGPHQGIMVVRDMLATRLPNQGHYFNAGTNYYRFTPAGPDHAQVAACAGMVDYIDAVYAHHHKTATNLTTRGSVVHDLMREQEVALLQPLLDYVAAKNSVRLIGPTDAQVKAPTVSMSLQKAGFEVAEELAKRNIMTGGGDFYGIRCLKGLGLDPDHGVLRLSFVHYTSKAEVDHLLEALDQVL